ncbi:MAG: peptide chain release factor N(5)-glutamine methyltransferase [Planctomycetota bacterium]
MSTPAQASWTTRRLLAWMSEAFEKASLESPRLQAEMLIAHVLGTRRLKLYMDPDRPASDLERGQLRDLVKRALEHEPVQYLVGEVSFYGLVFEVDRRVLVPRPATQTLVDAAIDHLKPTAHAGALLADVCTGSGCVAVTLASKLPEARVVATDISADAIEVARANAERHKVVDRVDFQRGDMLGALDAHAVTAADASLDALVSNPPYIPDDEWHAVPRNVREHEPELALRGGADGLDLVRPLIESAPSRLRPGGLLAIEVAASRAQQARVLAEAHPMLERVEIRRDSEGLDRVVTALRRG